MELGVSSLIWVCFLYLLVMTNKQVATLTPDSFVSFNPVIKEPVSFTCRFLAFLVTPKHYPN